MVPGDIMGMVKIGRVEELREAELFVGLRRGCSFELGEGDCVPCAGLGFGVPEGAGEGDVDLFEPAV